MTREDFCEQQNTAEEGVRLMVSGSDSLDTFSCLIQVDRGKDQFDVIYLDDQQVETLIGHLTNYLAAGQVPRAA